MAAVLAVRQVAAVLRQPPDERLIDLEAWVGPEGVLHVGGSLYDSDQFTGTPFAGLVLRPLPHAAEQALGWGWTFGTLLFVVVVALLAARALPQPVSRRTALLAPPVAISLLMLSLPVRNTLYLGQTSVIPVLLVMLGCFAVRGQRAGGVLIGVAVALQPTLLLFAALLWFTDRRRAAAAAGGSFLACTLLAWAALPDDSGTYWFHHLAGAGLGGDPAGLSNQSLHGALLRLGLSGPLEQVLFLLLAAVIAVVAVRRAVRYARDGQLLLAVAMTGCAAVAVSPTAWQHQLLWLMLAVAGRLGRRDSARPMWPVAVVLVMTLPSSVLIPDDAIMRPLRENLVLIAVVLTACVIPFFSRKSVFYATPIPTDAVPPGPTRFPWIPLLPVWRKVLTRPNLLLELALIRVGYTAYSEIRTIAAGSRAAAEEHGEQIYALERFLHIDIEHWVNHSVVKVPWLQEFFDFYYTSFHFFVPLTILAVLYVRRPVDYRWARSALGFATLLALLGFWLYPLAPPRLMPELGFIDTVHGAQDFGQPDYGALTAVTNQYAAMPSLHFGWSLWCGVVIVALAPKWWMKALGTLHPLFTVSAIVATANHWIMDAVGGAVAVATGFALVYFLSGPRPRTTPAEKTAAAARAHTALGTALDTAGGTKTGARGTKTGAGEPTSAPEREPERANAEPDRDHTGTGTDGTKTKPDDSEPEHAPQSA
ncbi:phosphatase PAP2 family protein [Streptomyces sp. NA04227]|uniref:bifunctional glycosyltransferase 87/phosphatase PAP2 family protein n=1 Tax=Streptomyces sp. NA04227 TaxID=2742136 RepID=UPI001591A1F9|nr:bifunctional glycosyltransferase 87/phosphatase PAP2 family protein [Streptomyces sp. NA04227]QKW10705.1 phosphatase PAP2 family protein [Streptomyces sp. NA04227]